ncbi:hypothetical protein Tco_0479004 [Tanacetum coccineum]
MRTDELHKFSDGTLNDVRSTLNDIAKGIMMEYLSMRKWSNLDKKRARVMVQDIDKQQYQRSQNRKDLPRDISLDSVVVLRYEKRSKSENKGKVSTEMELVLQQGTSFKVSVSVEEVEELKRNVKINGEKKEALLILRQKLVMRTASAAAKPCQGDSSEFYRIIGSFLTMVAVSPCQVEANTTCSYSTDIYKDIMKAQNIKKDGYTCFQHQEQYEHVGPEVTRSQEGKSSQDDVKRLCLVDDLKEVQDHIHVKLKIQVKA